MTEFIMTYRIKYRRFVQKWCINTDYDVLLNFDSRDSALETIKFFRFNNTRIELYNKNGKLDEVIEI